MYTLYVTVMINCLLIINYYNESPLSWYLIQESTLIQVRFEDVGSIFGRIIELK